MREAGLPPSRPPGSGELTAEKPSLVREARNVVVREIESGRWKAFLPGERTLAGLLQISRSTLRLALRLLENEGRLETAHGRRRKIVRRTLRAPAPAPARIALLSPLALEKIEPFVLLWLDHLRDLLARKKLALEVEVRPGCFSRSPASALAKLESEIPDAVWLLFHSTREMQGWFASRRLPHVVIGSTFDPASGSLVDLDQRAVGRHAAGSFFRHGRRRAAIFVSRAGLAGDRACVRGFLDGCAAASPPLHADVVEHDGTPQGVIQGADRLLSFRPRPDAVFVAGGMETVTILMRLAERDVRSPRDISVISRDDDPILDFVTPPPARFHRPPLEFARAVLRQIRRQMAFPGEAGRKIRLLPRFAPHATLGGAVGRRPAPPARR